MLLRCKDAGAHARRGQGGARPPPLGGNLHAVAHAPAARASPLTACHPVTAARPAAKAELLRGCSVEITTLTTSESFEVLAVSALQAGPLASLVLAASPRPRAAPRSSGDFVAGARPPWRPELWELC